jgi:hypothetical protein
MEDKGEVLPVSSKKPQFVQDAAGILKEIQKE